jgi:hypothetical protein
VDPRTPSSRSFIEAFPGAVFADPSGEFAAQRCEIQFFRVVSAG